jgi:hypothetical protein
VHAALYNTKPFFPFNKSASQQNLKSEDVPRDYDIHANIHCDALKNIGHTASL